MKKHDFSNCNISTDMKFRLSRLSSIVLVLISLIMLINLQYENVLYYLEISEPPAIYVDNPDNIVLKSSENIEMKNPTLHAKSACLMDASSNRVLFSKEDDIKLPMASTTKIMTCIIALESGRIDETAVVSKYAAGMPDVQLNVNTGESYFIKDLLYSLMLESHNDAAVVIAEHIGGSVEGFAALMNEKASKLGCTDTHFVTPNGLDNRPGMEDHYSTAKDMCIIASYAICNPEFISIIQTPSYSFSDVSGKRRFTVNNHDAFLNMYKGAIGIKTGFTGKAGYCFVGAARRGDITLTSCVLASGWPPDKSFKWSDTKALMDYGFSHFSYYNVNNETVPIILNPINVTDGVASHVALSLDYSYSGILSPNDSVGLVFTIPKEVPAPVTEGQMVGNARLFVNDEAWADYPIKAENEVKEQGCNDVFNKILRIFTEIT